MGASRCFSPPEALRRSAARKNRFLGFFKSSDGNDHYSDKKKKLHPRKEEQGFLKMQLFSKKYAFLPGVKNRRKRVKIRAFRNGFIL